MRYYLAGIITEFGSFAVIWKTIYLFAKGNRKQAIKNVNEMVYKDVEELLMMRAYKVRILTEKDEFPVN